MKASSSILRAMDHVCAEYVLEGEIPLHAAAPAYAGETFREKWQRVTATGWFLAASCAAVALIVVGVLIWFGQNGPGINPIGPPDTETSAAERDTLFEAEETEAEEMTTAETEAEEMTTAETEAEEMTTAETEAEETTEDALPDNLNFYGENVQIAVYNPDNGLSEAVNSVEQGESVLNTAIYERNLRVEERYNVDILYTGYSDSSDLTYDLVRMVHAGECPYHIIANTSTDIWTYAPSGFFVNLRQTPYLSLDREWWAQGYNEAARIGDGAGLDVQYAATGAMLLSPYRSAFMTAFNRTAFERQGLTSLYEYVHSNQWTLDTQAALIPLLYSRDNGTGDTTLYGFAGSTVQGATNAYWSACALDIIGESDASYRIDSDRVAAATDKIIALFHQNTHAVYVSPEGEDWSVARGELESLFAENGAAMVTLQMMSLENASIRAMGDQCGVVPMPKFDEAQTLYYSHIDSGANVVAIPVTVTEQSLKMTGAVLEAMSYEGYQTLLPTYTDTVPSLSAPYATESLLSILNGIHTDLQFINTDLNDYVPKQLSLNITSGSNEMKSGIKASQKTIEKLLKSLVTQLKKRA